MTNRSDEYDVIVLGVGTAGSKAARVAGEAGARVLAVESGERLGGLCILRGCMPTKTMLESAHRLHDARSSQDFGLVGGEGVSLDFAKHMERTQSLVERFRRAKVSGIESGPYEVRRATPRFVGPNEIELDGKERLKAKAFVVATGSKVSPFPFELPDGARILDSDDLFKLDEPPERTLVVGAGAVGLEFAQWLARVGSEVTLMNRSKLLRRWDVEMGEDLEAALSREMRVLVPS
ncbi:MAG: FAD-dependent oxidoreductase, partial [Planctomycetota bacterium]